jgi:hypothetical protein
MLHLVLHDVLEAFGLDFAAAVPENRYGKGDDASSSVSPGYQRTKASFRFIRQELESSVA